MSVEGKSDNGYHRSVKRAVLRLRTGITQVEFQVQGRVFSARHDSGRLFIMEKGSYALLRSHSIPWKDVTVDSVGTVARDILVSEVMGA
jgi:hypothetical protein